MKGYRYGFNGKENDNEVKGEGNSLDFGARIYDPRIGRFLSVDPLIKEQPSYSSYLFAGNRPTKHVDIDGALEGEPEPVPEGAPVFRVIIGGLRMPANMAPYSRYGMSNAGFEYERNPLSTAEQIKQEEAIRREEYIRNSLMIGGKWVPRSEDEVRDLRIQSSISAANKLNENNKPPLFAGAIYKQQSFEYSKGRVANRLLGLKDRQLNDLDIRFFGSRVKGTNRPDSDLDVLILTEHTDLFSEGSRLGKILQSVKDDFFKETGVHLDINVMDRSTYGRAKGGEFKTSVNLNNEKVKKN